MDKILGNKFIGTFKKESQENSDEFLKALGVNKLKRSFNEIASFVTEFTYEPGTDVWQCTIQISFKGVILQELKNTFRMGEERSVPTLDGRNAKVLVVLESENKLIARERWGDNKEANYVYEIDGDHINVLATIGNVYFSQKLKRLK